MRSYFYDLMKLNNFEDDKNFSWIIDKSIRGSKIPELFPRRKYLSIYKFVDKIEKKKLSLSVGNYINEYEFNSNNKINKNKKRSDSPVNLKSNNIKALNDEDDKKNEDDSDKSNDSSVNGVQQYKLDKFSDDEEEKEENCK